MGCGGSKQKAQDPKKKDAKAAETKSSTANNNAAPAGKGTGAASAAPKVKAVTGSSKHTGVTNVINGITLVSHTKTVLSDLNSKELDLHFDVPDHILLLPVLMQDAKSFPRNTLLLQNGRKRTIKVLFPNDGDFTLEIKKKSVVDSGYSDGVTYYISDAQACNPSENFPQFSGNMFKNGNLLLSPLDGKLKHGETYTFRLKMPHAEEVKVIVGGKEHKLIDNNNIFGGRIKIEDGESVNVMARRPGQNFGPILSYNIISTKKVGPLELLSHPSQTIETLLAKKLELQLEAPQHVVINPVLKKDGKTFPNHTLLRQDGQKRNVKVLFPEDGDYELVIQSKVVTADSYKDAFTYEIYDAKAALSHEVFPKYQGRMFKNGNILVGPTDGLLQKGDVYDFRLRLPNADHAKVSQGSKTVVLKEENDFFEGKFKVTGTEAVFVHLKVGDRDWDQILEYPVITPPLSNGIELISHPDTTISNLRAREFEAHFEVPDHIVLAASLTQGSETFPQNVLLVQNGKKRHVKVFFPKDGDFKLNIQKKVVTAEAFSEGVTYSISGAKGAQPINRYPIAAGMLAKNGNLLLNPIQGVLRAGQAYNFKLKLPHAESVQVVAGGKTTSLVETNDVFEGQVSSSVGEIKVQAKREGGAFEDIATYKAQDLPVQNKLTLVSHPDTSLTNIGAQEIDFVFEAPGHLVVSALLKSGDKEYANNTLVWQKGLQRIVRTTFPTDGEFTLHIKQKIAVASEWSDGVTYTITKPIGSDETFPTLHGILQKNGNLLLNPILGKLKTGQKYNFKLKLPSAESVKVNSTELVEQNDVFEGVVEATADTTVFVKRFEKDFEKAVTYDA